MDETQIQSSWHELLVATYAENKRLKAERARVQSELEGAYAENKRLKAERARVQSELEEGTAKSLLVSPVCSSRVKTSKTLK